MSESPTPATTTANATTTNAPDKKVPFYKNPFVIAFLIGAAILTVLPFFQRMALRAPPPVASLGEWQLTDQDGRVVSNETLKGQVWIASFFFSRCPSVCPQQQRDFSQILTHIGDLKADDKAPVRLVSFTVDPEFDTPAVLKAWGDKMGVDSSRWSLLSGPEASIKELLMKRMFVDVGERMPLPGDLFDISHASKFVLVDQNGDVRGYWGTDELARGNIINAARMIWKYGPTP